MWDSLSTKALVIFLQARLSNAFSAIFCLKSVQFFCELEINSGFVLSLKFTISAVNYYEKLKCSTFLQNFFPEINIVWNSAKMIAFFICCQSRFFQKKGLFFRKLEIFVFTSENSIVTSYKWCDKKLSNHIYDAEQFSQDEHFVVAQNWLVPFREELLHKLGDVWVQIVSGYHFIFLSRNPEGNKAKLNKYCKQQHI